MSDFNLVVISGRVVRDAELKYGQNGNITLRFSIANEKTKKNQDGTFSSDTFYFNCVVFGKYAEPYSVQLLKGRLVTIQGELKQIRWDQDGQNREKVEIICNNIIFQNVVRAPSYQNVNYQNNNNYGNSYGNNQLNNNNQGGYSHPYQNTPIQNNGNYQTKVEAPQVTPSYVNNNDSMKSTELSKDSTPSPVNNNKDADVKTSFNNNSQGPESFQDDEVPF